MADDVEVKFGADIANLTASMAQVREVLQGLSAPIRAIRDNLGELAEAFVAAFAIEKIAQWTEKFAELGAQTQRTSALLGVGNEQVAGMGLLAQATGGSLEGLTMSAQRLGLALARAGAGSEQQEAALKALGLTVDSIKGKKFEDQLAILADRFSVLKDGTEKDAIAMALLGRSGAQMIPIFNQGSAAIREFAAMSERAGSAMSHDQVEAAERLHLGIIELGAAFTGASNSIMTMFQPAISGVVRTVTDLVEVFTKSVNEGGLFGQLLNGLAIAAQVLVTALVIAVGAIETLWNVTKDVVFAMGESFMKLGRIIKDVFTFNWGDISAAWTDLQSQLQARAQISADSMEKIFGKVTAELRKIWNAAADDHVKIEQDKIARLNIVNTKGVAERLKLANLQYQNEVEQIELTYGKFIFNEGAKTQALFAALARRHQAEMEVAGTTADQKKVIDQKYENDKLKLVEQSVKAQEGLWKESLGTITSSFNSQLRGLLTGTTTWAQALKGIMLDLTMKVIEMVEKWAVEWAAGELAKTTATTTGVAVRTGAEQAGAASGIVTMIANVLKSITASTAQVFAGVSAFLAPVMGPAAPEAAAATAAAVDAGAVAMLPSLDVGTNMVMSSGLAMIHQGEEIKPAETSGPWQPGGGQGSDGGVHVHWTVQALDGADLGRFLRRNGAKFGRALNDIVRNGEMSGLSHVPT